MITTAESSRINPNLDGINRNNGQNSQELDKYLLKNNGVRPGDLGSENYKLDGAQLITYYDFNQDGRVAIEDIAPKFIDNKDLNQDGVVNLNDFIKAFTVDVKDQPDEYQKNIEIAKRAMQLKDTDKDGQIIFRDWDLNGDGVVDGSEALKNTDLDGDGYFTPQDTKMREQFVFSGVPLQKKNKNTPES